MSRALVAILFVLGLIAPLVAQAADDPVAQEILYKGEATSILGRTVTGADGAKIGMVVDVLVDEAGQPRAAVLDFGGFLGIGNRRVAVIWRALHFSPQAPEGAISVDLTEDQIRTTPEYKPATKAVMMAAPPHVTETEAPVPAAGPPRAPPGIAKP